MTSKTNKIINCSLIDLPKISKSNGSISVIENLSSIPFEVKRIYYLYDIPTGEIRGGHAHYNLHQYIIAISGSFTIEVDDGISKETIFLNNPSKAFYIVPGIWRVLSDFSSNAVLIVLASEKFDESDYIRNKNEFMNFKNE